MKPNVFYHLSRQTILILILLFTCSGLFAQDIYLPVTMKNKKAKELYKKAWIAFVNYDFTTSNKLANEALQIEPKFFMARYLTTFSFNDNANKETIDKLVNYDGKLNKVEKIFKDMITTHQKDPKLPYLPDWNKLVKLYPNNVLLINFQAYFEMNENNNPEKAKGILTKAISLDPGWAPYYNILGYTYLSLKNYQEAEKAFDKYMELTPQYANTYDSKGDYFMAVKNFSEAHKCFTKAFEMDKNMEFSKKKAIKAKHLNNCELVRPEIEKAADDFMQYFLDKDLDKHNRFYIKDGSFKYIWNGTHNFTLDEINKIHMQNFKEWKTFELKVTDKLLNIIKPTLAISYQNFELLVNKEDGTIFNLAGNFSVLWEKHEKEWKVVQFIEASNPKE